MNPHRYTGFVALNPGVQVALALALVDLDAPVPLLVPWPLRGAFFCLQLPVGWVFRLQPGPYGAGVLAWVIGNSLLWAAFLEAIACRYWSPPAEYPDLDDEDLSTGVLFRNSHCGN